MTALEIIEAAFGSIGVIGPGDTLADEDAADGLLRLNRMVDRWATNRLTIYVTERKVYDLVGGTPSYTIGSGGVFNQTRPLWIPFAGIIPDPSASVPVEIPIDVFPVQQYAAERLKTLQSTLPLKIYYDHGWTAGLGLIYPLPIPSTSVPDLVLYTPTALAQFADLTTDYTFPPGYAEALESNLAKRLAIPYGKAVSPELAELARESFADIKRGNMQRRTLRADPALLMTGGGFNWRTGR